MITEDLGDCLKTVKLKLLFCPCLVRFLFLKTILFKAKVIIWNSKFFTVFRISDKPELSISLFAAALLNDLYLLVFELFNSVLYIVLVIINQKYFSTS